MDRTVVLVMMCGGAVIAVAGCWPLDYSEDCELCESAGATTTGGGAGGGGMGGAGGAGGAPPVTELFVDPIDGDDGAAGTEDAPLKTLSKALSIATGGQTIHLFAGTYDAGSGEDYLTPVADGVTIAAIAPGEAILVGSGAETALSFSGSGAAWGLRVEGFAVGVTAAGAVTLQGLELTGNGTAIWLEGAAGVVMKGSSILGGVDGLALSDSARLTMLGGEIREVGADCNAKAIRLGGAAWLTLDGVNLHDSLGNVQVGNAAHATMTGCTVSAVGCEQVVTLLNAAILDLDQTSIEQGAPGNPGGAVIAAGSESQVYVAGGSVFAAHRGIDGGSTVHVEGATISGASGAVVGVRPGPGGYVTLLNVGLQGFATGVDLGSGSGEIRGCGISGNGIGVRVVNGHVELGSAANPGGNVLQGNSEAGLVVAGSAAWEHSTVGNTWIGLNQGTNDAGHFPLGTTVSWPFGTSGPAPHNVVVESPGPSVKLSADVVGP